jgi:hypothetical protein
MNATCNLPPGANLLAWVIIIRGESAGSADLIEGFARAAFAAGKRIPDR